MAKKKKKKRGQPVTALGAQRCLFFRLLHGRLPLLASPPSSPLFFPTSPALLLPLLVANTVAPPFSRPRRCSRSPPSSPLFSSSPSPLPTTNAIELLSLSSLFSTVAAISLSLLYHEHRRALPFFPLCCSLSPPSLPSVAEHHQHRPPPLPSFFFLFSSPPSFFHPWFSLPLPSSSLQPFSLAVATATVTPPPSPPSSPLWPLSASVVDHHHRLSPLFSAAMLFRRCRRAPLPSIVPPCQIHGKPSTISLLIAGWKMGRGMWDVGCELGDGLGCELSDGLAC